MERRDVITRNPDTASLTILSGVSAITLSDDFALLLHAPHGIVEINPVTRNGSRRLSRIQMDFSRNLISYIFVFTDFPSKQRMIGIFPAPR